MSDPPPFDPDPSLIGNLEGNRREIRAYQRDAQRQKAAAPAEWRIDLPLTRPLSMNDREHWRPKAARVAALRRLVRTLVQTRQVPAYPRIEIELHYTPRDARRRDATNLVATLKAVEDGIVDAGVVPDDTPQFVKSLMPIIDPPERARHGKLYVLIRPTGSAGGIQCPLTRSSAPAAAAASTRLPENAGVATDG